MIHIGIIGCGKIAQLRHIPEYAAHARACLHGFFDLNADRAAKVAAPYGGKVYAGWRELLDDPAIDAVSVLTPNFTHAEMTIAALDAGKHVLCEKPMAVTQAECDAMAAAARRTGKCLMIAQNQRFNAAHQRAKELLQSGAIGEVLTFRTTFSHPGADRWSIDGSNSWFMDKARGCFGAMADLGIHKTDLVVYLLGQKIVKASAVIRTLDKKDAAGKPISVDDNALCFFVTERGAVGSMTASWTNYGEEDNSTSLYGTTGAMHIYRDPAHAIVIERTGKPAEYFDVGAIQTNENQTASGVIDEFVAAVTEGRRSSVDVEDVLPAMRAIFACARSNEQGGALVDVEPCR